MKIITITLKIIIMIKNKGNREEKERKRLRERAIMYCYSTVTSKISNAVIFANMHFLHMYYVNPKYKTISQFLLLGGNKQNYYSQYKDINFRFRKSFSAVRASFIKS